MGIIRVGIPKTKLPFITLICLCFGQYHSTWLPTSQCFWRRSDRRLAVPLLCWASRLVPSAPTDFSGGVASKIAADPLFKAMGELNIDPVGPNHSQQLKKNGNGELGMASYQFSDMAPSILLKQKFPEIAVPCDKQHEVNKLVLVAPAEIFKWRLGEKRIVLMRF